MDRRLLDFINGCAAEQLCPDEVMGKLAHADAHIRLLYEETLGKLLGWARNTLSGPVYELPILSESLCDWLACNSHKCTFAPNNEEAAEYRIDEVIIESADPPLFEHFLDPIFALVFMGYAAYAVYYCAIFNSAKLRP